MKILWLSHLVPYPPRSGVAQRSYGLLNELCKTHEVTLLAFNQPGLMEIMSTDPEAELASSIDHLSDICARVEVFEIPSERSRYHRYLTAFTSLVRKYPYTINWLDSTAFTAAARNSGAQDVVHFDTISLAEIRHCFAGTPCVMNHHNIESHLLRRRADKTASRLESLYLRQEAARLRRYEQRTASDFALHLTCSELDRERLREIAGDVAVSVIPNGVDIDYFGYAASVPPAPTFVFVGTLGWGPNRDAAEAIVREIWPAIGARWPDARMTLVGSRPPESALSLSRRDDRFRVTGFVEDVRPYMEEASFFVCPIRDGGGTKLKILNAMAMGKAVIADRVATEGIDAQAGRDLMLASAGAEYVTAIESLLDNAGQYEALVRSARAVIERQYSYAAIGAELARQYEAVRAKASVSSEAR